MMLQPLYYVSCVAPSNWPNEKQRNRAFLFISILSPPTISHSQWKPMHITDLQQQDEHIKDNSVPLVTYWDPWRDWANVNKMLFSCYEKEECLLWSYKTIIKECHNHCDMTLLANNTWPIAGSHPAQGGCNAHALWAPKDPEGLCKLCEPLSLEWMECHIWKKLYSWSFIVWQLLFVLFFKLVF